MTGWRINFGTRSGCKG